MDMKEELRPRLLCAVRATWRTLAHSVQSAVVVKMVRSIRFQSQSASDARPTLSSFNVYDIQNVPM